MTKGDWVDRMGFFWGPTLRWDDKIGLKMDFEAVKVQK